MKEIAELATAIASLLWPLLAITALLILLPAIRSFLARDKVAIKIGGMEISAEQVAQQLVQQVEDLQNKVLAIEGTLAKTLTPSVSDALALTFPIQRGEKTRILWVDDFPSNNAIQIQKLMSDGYWIDVAMTTNQAIAMFELTKYDLAISDMGRTEDGMKTPNAGLLLAKEIRQRDKSIPIIIFTTHQAINRFQQGADKAGVNFITNSTVELYRQINSVLSKG